MHEVPNFTLRVPPEVYDLFWKPYLFLICIGSTNYLITCDQLVDQLHDEILYNCDFVNCGIHN